MTNFINDATGFAYLPKTDLNLIGDDDPLKFIQGSEVNTWTQAMLDIQSFILTAQKVFNRSDRTKHFDIEAYTATPNGVLTRDRGSLCVDTVAARLYQNTDGGTTWTLIESAAALAPVALSGSATDLTTGTLPIARIADGSVTGAKLAATAVTPGSYSTVNATVDQQGRITAMSTGTPAVNLAVSVKQSPYNAVGNGTADDTAAIQSAHAAAVAAGGQAVAGDADGSCGEGEGGRAEATC